MTFAPRETEPRPQTRRAFVQHAGQALTLAATGSLAPVLFTGCSRSKPPETIKVGILHSQTGTMAISETSLRDAELFAIEEINAAGGVLGKLLVPVVENPRSRSDDLYPRKALRLIVEDGATVVFGCWTSASRKAVLPIFEEQNGLLFYPLQYEGNESSSNIIYTGSTPNQQILPAVDWLRGSGRSRSRFYLIGSDYVFPWTANYIIARHLAAHAPEVEIVGTQYVPLGQRKFSEIIADITAAKPDVIVSTINGDSNIYFYQELAAQGVTPDQIPVLATSVGEDELRSLQPEVVTGHLAAWSYFQSLDTPENRSVVERFQREHGEDRVFGDPMEAAYCSVHLWKRAVEQAGTVAVDAVIEALGQGLEFQGPGGVFKIDPKTRHAYKHCRVGKIREDRQFEIVYDSQELIAPDPYPQVAFPGWSCDWTRSGVTKGDVVPIGPGSAAQST